MFYLREILEIEFDKNTKSRQELKLETNICGKANVLSTTLFLCVVCGTFDPQYL